MGTDIVVQVALMPGVRIGAISEVRMSNAIDAAVMSGRERGDVVETGSASGIDGAIEAGKIAVTGDYKALCAAGRIDVVIDATGNPNVGTLVALEAMRNGKHVVLLNVEADITIGRFLKEEARKAGVVFTASSAGAVQATGSGAGSSFRMAANCAVLWPGRRRIATRRRAGTSQPIADARMSTTRSHQVPTTAAHSGSQCRPRCFFSITISRSSCGIRVNTPSAAGPHTTVKRASG